MSELTAADTERLTSTGLRLAQFTVADDVPEGIVAITAGLAVGLILVVGFGIDSGIKSIAAVLVGLPPGRAAGTRNARPAPSGWLRPRATRQTLQASAP